ncbi:hypothetical protein Salat_1169900 [Sesamum alatum]|uniref:BSD domain-containing protein n=1 Tax=Sesamum alatum TaxID=300844 RepID=A0AAE1YF42_9LAMI|nr:hypothetical protein Salat_1169900 [Sesamum alatum]
MSWLARSIANTLRLDDEEEEDAVGEKEAHDDAIPRPTRDDAVPPEDRPRDSELYTEDRRLTDSDGGPSNNHGGDEDFDDDNNQGRGVKEDLSELKESLTRQIWGVASFLAPPPPPPPPLPLSLTSGSFHLQLKSDGPGLGNADDDEGEEDEELVEYEERDSGGQFSELGNFYPSEDYYTKIIENAVGITEEVLAFARNIAHHPETWLDFPLSEEEEFDDFDISDAQYKHALAVEYLAPRLAALRIELCPVHMSEGYFWMVYFVLLHSRLNKHDADLLSSPQIVQARAMWMQELQKRTKEESYWLGMNNFHSKESADSPRENFIVHSYEDAYFGNVSDQISPYESSMHHMTADHEIEKHPFNEVEFIDKSVIKEDPAPKLLEKEIVVGSSIETPVDDYNVDDDDDDDDDDDWLKEDPDLIGYSGTSIVVNEEDISFSDLEEDLDCSMPIKYKVASTEENRTKTS